MAIALETRIGTASPSRIVAICFAVAVLEGYDIQAIGVAAPKMGPALALTSGQMGLALASSMIGLILGSIGGGWLADRIGRKPVLTGSIAAFGLFSLATIFVHGFDTLFAARLLTGLGFGGALPNLLSLATAISPRGRRVGTAAIMCAGMPTGGALAALFAHYALHALDWRWVFLIGGLLPLLVAPIVMLMLNEPARRPHHPGAEAQMRALSALFGPGQAVTTLLLWLSYPLTIMVMYLFLNWLPLLVVAKGLPASSGATAALVFNLASVAGSILIGKAVDRFGVRWPMMASYLLLLATMMVLAAAESFWAIAGLSGAAGFLVSGAQYTLYGLTPACYPPAMRGTGSGAAVGVGRIGSVVSPIVAGALFAAGSTAGQVVAATAPVIIIAGLAVLALTFFAREHAD